MSDRGLPGLENKVRRTVEFLEAWRDRRAEQIRSSKSSESPEKLESDSGASVATEASQPEAKEPEAKEQGAKEPIPFSGGQMVFFDDRVELCGVVICSGPRSQTKREILELLAKKRGDGTFVAYSNKELDEQLKLVPLQVLDLG